MNGESRSTGQQTRTRAGFPAAVRNVVIAFALVTRNERDEKRAPVDLDRVLVSHWMESQGQKPENRRQRAAQNDLMRQRESGAPRAFLAPVQIVITLRPVRIATHVAPHDGHKRAAHSGPHRNPVRIAVLPEDFQGNLTKVFRGFHGFRNSNGPTVADGPGRITKRISGPPLPSWRGNSPTNCSRGTFAPGSAPRS